MTMVRVLFAAAAAATVVAPSARAQQPVSAEWQPSLHVETAPQTSEQQGELVVKTVPLHHLTSAAAVKLLMPYVRSPGGGVFEVSSNIRAVTIREVQKNFNEMMTVLVQYDHDPATITLNFQLIAAENTNARDPAVAGLDSLLRGVLKYTGYRLLNTSVASATENGRTTQTLTADGTSMALDIFVDDVLAEGGSSAVQMHVSLYRASPGTALIFPGNQILSTGVTVPIGQTVVLGTSSPGGTGAQALILTVRPQMATKR